MNYIRHTDWLGSSRLATTWSHGIFSKEAYAPFGETCNEAGTPDRSFTGQDQDVVTGSGGTGVYDFLFRKYDPSAGRWLSPDPLGWGAVNETDPQSLDRYAYVENQPMDDIDPMGLYVWSIGNCSFDTVWVSVDGQSQGEDTELIGCNNQSTQPSHQGAPSNGTPQQTPQQTHQQQCDSIYQGHVSDVQAQRWKNTVAVAGAALGGAYAGKGLDRLKAAIGAAFGADLALWATNFGMDGIQANAVTKLQAAGCATGWNTN